MRRDHDQMNVIRHRAIAQNGQLRIAGGGSEQVEVRVPVLVVEEDIAAKVSPLRNVMWAANGHHSAHASHHLYSGREEGKISPNRAVQ